MAGSTPLPPNGSVSVPSAALVTTVRRFIRLKNWDRTTINLPFGRGALVGGDIIMVPTDADTETMEKLRAQLEATLNDATRRAYAQVGHPEEAGHARQGGSRARQRAPGHEPGRQAAWTVGVDSRRQRRRGAGRRGPDREAAGAEYPHPADLGHGDVGGDRRQAISRRHHPPICALRFTALRRALPRSLAAFAGAVHRVRFVAQSDPGERGAAIADGLDQRTDVAPLVSALAPGGRHDLRAAWPVRRLSHPIRARCRTLCRAP